MEWVLYSTTSSPRFRWEHSVICSTFHSSPLPYFYLANNSEGVSSVDIDTITGEMVATVKPEVDFVELEMLREVVIISGIESGGN